MQSKFKNARLRILEQSEARKFYKVVWKQQRKKQ